MSIQRSQTSQASEVQRTDDARVRDPRQPAPPESVDRFKALMAAKEKMEQPQGLDGKLQEQQLAGEQQSEVKNPLADDALRHRTQDASSLSDGSLTAAEVLAMAQVQAALRDGVPTPQAAPPPAANPAAFADMIEKHVRQLAVNGANGDTGDGKVLLRMADSTLPGTDLLLSRTADGWMLRADVRSRTSYDAIREAAPELAKRFAERNLGTLEIDPHYDG